MAAMLGLNELYRLSKLDSFNMYYDGGPTEGQDHGEAGGPYEDRPPCSRCYPAEACPYYPPLA